MVFSIRSGSGASSISPARRRAPREADAVVFWATAGFAALVATLFFAIPVQADEIEPEPEPAPQAEPEPEPEPEPKPVLDVVSEEEAFSEPSWIPSIETGFETFDYNVDTTIVNHLDGTWDGSQSEAERQLMFRIGGELMGPMFEDLPGRPRLFVKGGAQILTFSSDKIFDIGDPYVAKQPEKGLKRYQNGGPGPIEVPREIFGQGSQVDARFQDPSWYAGLGVAFSVPIASNLLLYLKPSVQYSMEKIDLPGGLTTLWEPIPRVDPDDCQGKNPNDDPMCVREFIAHRSRAKGNTTDHSVGVGLEVALVPFKSTRPIRVSLYAEARFLWLLSGSTTNFADSPPHVGCEVPPGQSPDVCFEDPRIDGSIATYSVVRDDFNIKGGGGLRFSWVGFD